MSPPQGSLFHNAVSIQLHALSNCYNNSNQIFRVFSLRESYYKVVINVIFSDPDISKQKTSIIQDSIFAIW